MCPSSKKTALIANGLILLEKVRGFKMLLKNEF